MLGGGAAGNKDPDNSGQNPAKGLEAEPPPPPRPGELRLSVTPGQEQTRNCVQREC